MNTEEKFVGIVTIILAISVILAIPTYFYKEKILVIIHPILNLNWKLIGIRTAVAIISLFILYRIIRYIYRKIKYNKEKKEAEIERIENTRNKLRALIRITLGNLSPEMMREKLDKTKKEIEAISPEIRDEFQKEIKEFYAEKKDIIKRKIRKEELLKQQKLEQEERERQEEERKEREHKSKVKELYDFKLKKKDPEAVPTDKTYSKRVISEATWEARGYFSEQQEYKENRDEAIEYYRTHDLDTQPHFEDEEKEEIWAEVRDDIENKKIELKKKVKIEFQGEKLKKNFYRADEFDEDEKRIAKAQGFKYVRVPNLDGFLRGGFYIRKENPRETDYHFVMKHLFAELHDNIYVEETIDGRRIDAVFLLENFKLGIEVETGANRENYLAAKIQWLNKNFDQWIFVCPKKLEAKYDKYVNNKKSFCMKPKKAKEFIEKILISAEEPMNDR
ncbi:hypothetical protein HN419_03880 [Candidatus Woesearchaeota archaeon]|nr:hypothetical protein [Candidatus Woesearchaeota archaeon]MBT3537982.1 hypothetical protein [Candidatus Woesearchaeota archaeon]MBT4697337.1 hypothetical protein [Candidatus Woesearchaeota archaeon]MBT4717057.1 hypothetical protein [Candidatus Woesearchaeota archaeon]MBT7105651.1 hypothetical protein [Candidatus Woesearchaeota archaeon]